MYQFFLQTFSLKHGHKIFQTIFHDGRLACGQTSRSGREWTIGTLILRTIDGEKLRWYQAASVSCCRWLSARQSSPASHRRHEKMHMEMKRHALIFPDRWFAFRVSPSSRRGKQAQSQRRVNAEQSKGGGKIMCIFLPRSLIYEGKIESLLKVEDKGQLLITGGVRESGWGHLSCVHRTSRAGSVIWKCQCQ